MTTKHKPGTAYCECYDCTFTPAIEAGKSLAPPSGSAKRGLVCCFCGEGWGYEGQEPREEELKAAVDHEAKCPRNPYLAEIEKLKADVAHWQAVANYYRNTSPNIQAHRQGAEKG